MPSLKLAQPITQDQALKPVRGWKPPSEAQRDAGNYKKYTFWWEGLHVSIENPKGSYRSGTDSRGKKWKTTMKNAYGYFKGTEGVDGDHLDVFVGPYLKSPSVYVVNQEDPATGEFDEHKCVIGARSKEEARQIYLRNYQKGWKGLQSVKAFTVPEFKEWARGRITGPVKTAGELPWRDRAEAYAVDSSGKIYGGTWKEDGSFAVPGGGVDPGEDPQAAAVREMLEEAGIVAKNPRLLPIPPVENVWDPESQQRRGFKGSRTHFVRADYVGPQSTGPLDKWTAEQRGMYDPADAVKRILAAKNPFAPDVNKARVLALQAILGEAPAVKAALWMGYVTGG